jgi:NAD(P)-dependent dehydrogenase (short-subunit alcohol dehydrogenase family)
VVTARDTTNGQESIARLREEVPGTSVDLVLLDLASLTDAKRAASEVASAYDRVDILVNNAGIMATPKRKTDDGFELQIGTNHLGHFAWTATLWPVLKASDARVVTVSSLMHARATGIDLRTLTPEGSPRRYFRWTSYAESKLANLSFALELNRRVKAAGLGVVSVGAHPGYALTNLQKTGTSVGGGINALAGIAFQQVSRIVGQSAAMGAWPLLLAATDPSLTGGEYIGPSALAQTRGRPKPVGMTRWARDEDLADNLWTASEQATGVEFDV